MAVAFHPDLEYVALEHNGELYIVADALAKATIDACKLEGASIVARFPGRKLEYATFAHPFLDRSILGVLANYVTTEQGTGAVHTAPSHGADDFYTGTKYKLDQRTNVDEAGHLQNGLPEYEGKTVFQANQPIVELLKARGVLMAEARSSTRIRIAGAATIPSSSAPPSSGSSPWKRRWTAARCASARSMRSRK